MIHFKLKSLAMTKMNLLTGLALLLGITTMSAQFDDLYYIEADDNESVEIEYTDEYDDDEYDDSYDYDDSEYEYYAEYDNYYSNRIRRFNRPAGLNYYSPYYVNDFSYDPFYSYYAPSYISYDRFGRAFLYSPNRRYGTSSFLTVNFGNTNRPFRTANNGWNRWSRFGNAGFGSSPVGAFNSRGGAAGCPIGGFGATGITRNTTTTRPAAARGTYRGARRSTSTRIGSSPRTNRSTPQTYKSNRGSSPAPRAKSSSRRSATKYKSNNRSSNYRSKPSRSRSYKSSSRSSSSFKSSSRSSSSRSSGSSRSGRRR